MLITRLSQQERNVSRMVARGLSNKEVARELGVTEATIKAHLRIVMAKVCVRNRVELAIKVERNEVPI